MGRIKNTLTKRWLHIVLPVFIIFIWLILSSFGGQSFGKLNGVSSNDQASFLPASADSTKVQAAQSKFLTSSTIPAIVVIEQTNKNQPIVPSSEITTKLASINGVSKAPGSVVGPIISKDGQAAVEYIVQVNTSAALDQVAKDMRNMLNENVASGEKAYVTGPAGLSADLVSAFSGIDGILLFVAVGTVFVILLLVYRSIVLPFLVLITAMFALSAAVLVVYLLASHNIIKLNGQSQGILSILVIGAATDYSLLMISRYRESLGHNKSKWDAIVEAYKYSIEPIAASAATVVLALLCLLFSDLNSNKSLGPIAALGIVFSLFAALSLLPAFLYIFGRNSFWPFRPKFHIADKEEHYSKMKTGLEDRQGFWLRIPQLTSRKYRPIWIALVIILLLASVGLFQLKASGVSQAATILGKSNAVSGQDAEARHFPAGSGSPVVIVTSLDKSTEVLNTVKANNDISEATIYSGAQYGPGGGSPLVINDKVLVEATLKTNADSAAAQATVTQLRKDVIKVDSSALVGGNTAIELDTNNTAKSDLRKIIPIVLIVILIVLILLLRSLIAPLILVGSVILSFAGSLGISALVFNHIFHFPGSDATVPLFGFIFLVALGVDYNIFLMSRVREESKKIGTRPGILRGLSVTGGVITSAGIVLAATFAALAVIPILFLAQLAFIVAFGVLIDSIFVRSLLVPALTYDVGKFIWWPSRLKSK